MIRLREISIEVSLILVIVMLSSPSHIRAQAIASESGPPQACSKRDLEIHFGFFESPKNYFNLVVQGLNISSHTCTFEYDLFDPRFSGDSPHFKCQDCAQREREGYRDDSVVTSFPIVRPSEIVRRQYRWRTVPESGSNSCFRPSKMDTEYASTWTIAAPSLIGEVCSDISVVGTDVLAPRSTSQTETLWTSERTKILELTALRSAYYIDEEFPLTISHQYLPPPGPEPGKCRPIFLWHRSADGTIRVGEHTLSSTDDCSTLNLDFLPDRTFYSSESNLDEAERLSNYGDQELQVFQQVDRGDLHFHFLTSNVLHVRIEGADNPNLRNWTKLKGLAADILLDGDTYVVGEDIPLHLAIANLDATDPIYSWDPIWDPCFSIGIEVLDDKGNTLPANDRISYPPAMCNNGHGFGPRPFKRGKITSLEWRLKETGWLPKSPGNYTVVLSWCTSTGLATEWPNRNDAKLSPYATVLARATIHIVSPKSKVPTR